MDPKQLQAWTPNNQPVDCRSQQVDFRSPQVVTAPEPGRSTRVSAQSLEARRGFQSVIGWTPMCYPVEPGSQQVDPRSPQVVTLDLHRWHSRRVLGRFLLRAKNKHARTML